MALIALIYSRVPGSPIALAKITFFMIAPVFVIGPVAGAYVDRWDRKYTMIVSDLLRAALVIFIPVCIISFKTLVPVYILVLFIFSATRFFLPSKMAIIPDLVSKEDLLIANSLASTTRMIATVIGMGLAGILVGAVGSTGAFYIDSGTYLFSAVTLAMIAIGGKLRLKEDLIVTKRAIEDALVKRSIFAQVLEGMRVMAKDKNVKFSLFNQFLLMAGVGSIFAVVIVFVQEVFGSATKHVGLLGMFLGLGLFLGTLTYGRMGHKFSKRKAIYLSFFGSGVFICIFAVSLRQWACFFTAGISTFLLGICIAPIIVATHTMIHEAVQSDVRGRIFSCIEAVIHMGFLVCMFITARLAETLDRGWILMIPGAVFIIFGAFGVLTKKAGMKRNG